MISSEHYMDGLMRWSGKSIGRLRISLCFQLKVSGEINEMKTDKYMTVLNCRYIHFMSWEKIADSAFDCEVYREAYLEDARSCPVGVPGDPWGDACRNGCRKECGSFVQFTLVHQMTPLFMVSSQKFTK